MCVWETFREKRDFPCKADMNDDATDRSVAIMAVRDCLSGNITCPEVPDIIMLHFAGPGLWPGAAGKSNRIKSLARHQYHHLP